MQTSTFESHNAMDGTSRSTNVGEKNWSAAANFAVTAESIVFIIDVDHTNVLEKYHDEQIINEVFEIGRISPSLVTYVLSGGGFRFRLYDDDDFLYYEGRIAISPDAPLDDYGATELFSPLDCFGESYAGCTSIKFLKNGKWEGL